MIMNINGLKKLKKKKTKWNLDEKKTKYLKQEVGDGAEPNDNIKNR